MIRKAAEKDSRTRAFLVLLSAVGLNLILGIHYAWSIISRSLTVEPIGWSNQEAAFPFTVASLVFPLALLGAGSLQDRIGPKGLVLGGVFLAGSGLVLAGFALSPLGLTLAYGVVFGTGFSVAYSCLTPAAMKWFSASSKGLVVGLVVGGFALASLYAAPLASWLVGEFGVFVSLRYLGVFVYVLGLPLGLLIRNPSVEGGVKGRVLQRMTFNQSNHAALSGQSGQSGQSGWRSLVSSREYWVLWVMLAFSSSSGLLVIGNLAKVALVQGGIGDSFVLVMLLGLFNALGRVFMGLFSDKAGRLVALRLLFVLQLVNLLLFGFYSTPFLLGLGAVVAGFCYGGLLSVFPALVADVYGLGSFGRNYGVVYTPGGILAAFGPLIGALVLDHLGSFVVAFVVSGLLVLVALLLSFRLGSIGGSVGYVQG